MTEQVETSLRVLCARGPRAAEEALLEAVGTSLAACRASPSRLSRPVVIVVPSRSLREHLLGVITRRFGAVAGVEVMTLRTAAGGILRRAGSAVTDGSALVPVFVRRAARGHAAFRDVLDGLEDGYSAVVPVVNDLLDAGLEPVHLDAALEQISEVGTSHASERAAASFRIAIDVTRDLDAAGRVHRSGFFRAAQAQVQATPGVWPARETWIHGYADATGSQADLLEALLRTSGGTWLLDLPPNPADPDREDAGVTFLERLRRRATSLGPAMDATETERSEVGLFRAPGIQAEVREVAERIAIELERGQVPERLGVVVRELSGYAAAIRAQFSRVGIPFSAAPGSSANLRPDGRRVRMLRQLLEDVGSASVDRWIALDEALEADEGRDLVLAFHAIGRPRVSDAAASDWDELLAGGESLPLPVRTGIEVSASDIESASAAVRAPRRRVPRALLDRALAQARCVETVLESWPREASLAQHRQSLDELLVRALGWNSGSPLAIEIHERLDALEDEVGQGFVAEREEWLLLVDRAWADIGRAPLGGEGGGVAVLTVTDARARTFDQLFMLGVNRDRFPLAIPEDPLLPDAFRRRLEWDLLPDIPIKHRGFDEERYLFAQCCASAPSVTVSWVSVSDDGKEKSPSPFVERLRLAAGLDDVFVAPEWLFDRGRPVPPDEAATLAGLSGDRVALRAALEVAEGPAVAGFAQGRLAVGAELDRGGRRGDLGPYLGIVGAGAMRGRVAVTHLERIARCGWQAFLQRALHLDPVPDAMSVLPDLNPMLLGNVVHAFLEAVAVRAGVPVGVTFPHPEPGIAVAWPSESEARELLMALSAKALVDEGIALPGFAGVLAAQAAVRIERIREVDWADGMQPVVVAVEAQGAAVVADGERQWTVTFRADRIDQGPVLTDYKSGRAITDLKSEDKRARDLLLAIGKGWALQLALYAMAGGEGARARYLAAGSPAAQAVLSNDGIEAEVVAAGEKAASTLLRAREAGALTPQLVDAKGKTPIACGFCELHDACRKHDTAARHRLLDWVEEPGDVVSAGESAFREIWSLANPGAGQ